MQENLPDSLLSAKQYDKYAEFLLENDTPLCDWKDVDRLPEGYDMEPFVERLKQIYKSCWDEVAHGMSSAVPDIRYFFDTLSCMIQSDRLSKLFEWVILHTHSRYFRSPASDNYDYDGVFGMFNDDKVYTGKYASLCLKKLLSFGADIPDSIQDEVNLLKLCSCYCEGSFGPIGTLLRNFPSFFTEEVCIFFFPEKVLDEKLKAECIEFNTACLAQCYLNGADGKIVRKLISCGADVTRAKQLSGN